MALLAGSGSWTGDAAMAETELVGCWASGSAGCGDPTDGAAGGDGVGKERRGLPGTLMGFGSGNHVRADAYPVVQGGTNGSTWEEGFQLMNSGAKIEIGLVNGWRNVSSDQAKVSGKKVLKV